MIPRVAALLLLLAGAAVAAETSADDTIRFHRVLVPENRVNDWPTGGAKYLPMDASAFERLLEAAKPALTHTPSPPRTAVSAARYKARLVGERLVGSAVLDVAHSDAGPVMLPIDPCNIAIDRPTWRNGATDQEAELGLAADGRFQLRVDRAGRLCFEWSLAGRNDTDDALSFDLELPVGLGNRLDLELPAAASVVVDRGIAIGGENAGSGLRRWEIEWGNNGICRLRILRKGESNAARPQLALLRESRTYECSLRGVDVSAQWRVEAHNRPLREITLLLDAGLQLVSAQLGETEIPWRAVPASDREPARVLLRLPEPISDCERVIRLGAIGPAVLDREWRLPRIRCAQLSWQEGTVTLLATEPLSVNRILPHGCTQTDAGSFGSRGGQSAQFQCFDSDATVDVLLASPAVTLPSSAAQPFSATMRRAPAEIAGIAKPKMDGQPACVKEVRLWSWYQADGAARNVAIYDLRGCGRRLELAAPAAAIRWDVRSVHVDGRPAVWRWTTDETGGRISVTLPTNRPQPRVTVEWTDAVARLGVVTTLAAILPTPRVPVLDSHWVIVPPPGYEPVDATNGKFAGVASADETSDQRLLAVQPLTLTQRLFGSLGRGDVERRFNPLSGDDWMNLWAWGKPKGDLARAWHLEFASQTPATIRLVHRASVQLLSNTILLVTAAIGCWLV
ncbi:MAG: hypothetical protein LLG00_16505, partial [Planctomycetaceae bacterium]|nr:hypothetical protein [Planctomycetaceae bacterium]